MSNKANPSDLQRYLKRFWLHLFDFPYIWITITLLVVFAIVAHQFPNRWVTAEAIGSVALVLMTLLLLSKPMNAIYGLIGATGSIRLFFANFILITAIFAFIYQFGFFINAGITYDVNQPHIDFQMFAGTNKVDSIKVSEKRDTIFLETQKDSATVLETYIHVTEEKYCYQRVGFMKVWRSTIITTLTQDASDLLTIASVHNKAMDSSSNTFNEKKSNLFEWILIFHIFISWIFFGVFISLLYNKFRYES